jgi:hypothetical protein
MGTSPLQQITLVDNGVPGKTMKLRIQNRPPNLGIKTEITRKVLDARRRGATTEAYGAIRRKEERSKATPQMMP